MSPALVAVASALVLSLAGNAVLGWAWLGTRDALVQAVSDRDLARSSASACSDATDDLRKLADRRAAVAKKAQAIARSQAAAHEQLAQTILSTPAALTGDDCGSARVRVDRWLIERGVAR
ncbi:hypothetical protein QTH87_06025 [Variovorax sp. J22P168]|uniref:hypothetical protein n=1 Tax=Variovorax jilinensis TaxID=3053513 RepID=UPI00257535C1|nr:hypothetical protein [Variovorax sp. J22P168]MDM0011996.1 hypothetical protein [Variovorax sp. J22P168]